MKTKLPNKLLTLSMLFLSGFLFAQVPAYYNGTNINQSGEALKTALANLITTTQAVELSYTPGVWNTLQQSDLDPANNNNVLLIYGSNDNDGNLMTDRSRDANNNGGSTGQWNREHTYPRSLGQPNLGSEGPGSDAHHLRPSDIGQNSSRSNLAFTAGSGIAARVNGGWYPGDEWRGDVARMMMFMYTRWGERCAAIRVANGSTTFSPEMPDILLQWNVEDPVSAFEIQRNNVVAGIQGNRNPFIDNPAFATSIWGGPQAEDRFGNGGSTDVEAPSAPANLVASNVTQTTVDLTWDAATDNVGVTSYQIFNGTTLVDTSTTTSYTVSNLTANTAYTFTVKAVDAAFNASAESNVANVTTLEDTTPPVTGDAGLIITGVFDGPLTGGTPKLIELYATADIADLSAYGFGSANNGGGTDGQEFAFTGTATKGDFIYIATEVPGVNTFFGITPNFTSGAAGINGDDAVELFFNGNVVDIFGDIAVDGSGQAWEYTDGWAYRTAGSGPDGANFTIGNWTFSGRDAMDGQVDNATATTPFPIGTYTPPAVASDLKITGVVDATLTGGTPKAIEIFVINDVADLSIYGFGSANNGGGTDGQEFAFTGSATAGDYIYIATETVNFNIFFGFEPNFTTNAAAINGDDAIELFKDGEVVDVFGDISVDGSGQAWEYTDGWAKRKDNTGPDANAFNIDNWTFSGRDALDGQTDNATATNPFPIAVTPVAGPALRINGVFDGPLTGGTPKAIELEVLADIADLSIYGFGSANNGGGTDGQEFAFTGSAVAGDKLYIATEEPGFVSFFGFTPNFISGAAAINGDDAVELFQDGEVIDVFGDIAVDGSGQAWEYTDGWAYRVADTGPDGSNFTIVNWTFSGPNALDGETTNATAANPFPIEMDPVEAPALRINGVFDGPLTGGTPKAIELEVLADIADLSIYGFGSANNGGGTDGQEFAFTGSATTGDKLYIATEETGFTTFFGFAPNFISGAAAINGDDAVELFKDGEVIDVFGDIAVDGSGQAWEYTDGWAFRKENTGPDGSTFILDNWIYSGRDALDGATDNATATNPYPGVVPIVPAALIITGVVDGPLSGGTPKVIELLATADIADLSIYGFGSANNGGGTDGQEFTFTGTATAGEFIYIATETTGFTSFFGFEPNFTTGVAGINGDDAIELFKDGEVIDVFGEIAVDGTGQPWEYLDGWAKRKEGTGADGSTFVLDNWTFSGPNALDGQTSNATAPNPFPIDGGGVIVDPELSTIAEVRATTDGTAVKVTGVLTVSDNFGGSAFIQDNTGGIAVFDAKVHGDGLFAVGDSITIVGTRSTFREQIQISPVLTVESNGTATNPIEPVTITLAELSQYSGQLVRVENPVFPRPNDVLFGSTNYNITDASGAGQLRLDNNVDSLIGLAQPESCGEVVGVVGRFNEIFQLLPRSNEDLTCAGEYVNPADAITVSKDKTFDVVTWNIEWFGDEENSPAAGNPMSDQIQKDSVKAVIQRLDVDIIAVQEIADDVLFGQMIDELPEYSYVLSDAVSRPNDPGVKQKVGFIYKNATVENVATKVLLESIHPLYNGGDDSALVNYPSTTDRFYASGRLPFMMTANVTIEGESKEFNIIDLHARANSSNGAQNRYDMRKYDVEVLKDSLDAFYPNANIILLGDYNDDVDVTVADITSTVTSYEEYVADGINYEIVTSILSENGFRSFVARENLIDHISVSDELANNDITGSTTVHYEFFDGDYSRTTSDHFPVSTRFQLNELSLGATTSTDVSCNGEGDGSASITATGGITPYTYLWSDGQETATATNLSAGDYSVIVVDALGNELMSSTITISEPAAINLTLIEDQTVYFGYGPEESALLTFDTLDGGDGNFTYEWSTGETTDVIEVSPEETTQYTLTVTDGTGCSVTGTVNVEVVDVRCGNNTIRPRVELCFRGRTRCVSTRAVPSFLRRGATLGSCDSSQELVITNLKAFPNAFRSQISIWVRSTQNTNVDLVLYDFTGNVVKQSAGKVYPGFCKFRMTGLGKLPGGVYFLKAIVDGKEQISKKMVKF
ncbi:endonuclease [Spongiivirga citrea]|uniref:T9SS type A sorting domain-containing protein n=1 Tax=Spongiivirga citrea TaxID=1481457 RepID=A0A6M0CCR0_9FLAO|nr:endonuclease [Spongiivirga citrea]NER15618.1 T9SS type A sorting domain-containing protein [Spongiivirga citrea]